MTFRPTLSPSTGWAPSGSRLDDGSRRGGPWRGAKFKFTYVITAHSQSLRLEKLELFFFSLLGSKEMVVMAFFMAYCHTVICFSEMPYGVFLMHIKLESVTTVNKRNFGKKWPLSATGRWLLMSTPSMGKPEFPLLHTFQRWTTAVTSAAHFCARKLIVHLLVQLSHQRL